jgi:hypothetical protein
MSDTNEVDRFEVIDETGRAYVKGSIHGSPVKVQLDYQDDGRTLKVFVEPAGSETQLAHSKATNKPVEEEIDSILDNFEPQRFTTDNGATFMPYMDRVQARTQLLNLITKAEQQAYERGEVAGRIDEIQQFYDFEVGGKYGASIRTHNYFDDRLSKLQGEGNATKR